MPALHLLILLGVLGNMIILGYLFIIGIFRLKIAYFYYSFTWFGLYCLLQKSFTVYSMFYNFKIKISIFFYRLFSFDCSRFLIFVSNFKVSNPYYHFLQFPLF